MNKRQALAALCKFIFRISRLGMTGSLSVRLFLLTEENSSICADNPISPFGITERTISRILRDKNVPVSFLDVVLAFGDFPENGDAGLARVDPQPSSGSQFGQPAHKPARKRGIISLIAQADIHYLLTYVELANGARWDDLRHWTTMQLGVYQQYSRTDDRGFCILLHPEPESVVQKRISGLGVHPDNQPRTAFELLYDVHRLVIWSHLRNWQAYLVVLNSAFEKMVSNKTHFHPHFWFLSCFDFCVDL